MVATIMLTINRGYAQPNLIINFKPTLVPINPIQIYPVPSVSTSTINSTGIQIVNGNPNPETPHHKKENYEVDADSEPIKSNDGDDISIMSQLIKLKLNYSKASSELDEVNSAGEELLKRQKESDKQFEQFMIKRNDLEDRINKHNLNQCVSPYDHPEYCDWYTKEKGSLDNEIVKIKEEAVLIDETNARIQSEATPLIERANQLEAQKNWDKSEMKRLLLEHGAGKCADMLDTIETVADLEAIVDCYEVLWDGGETHLNMNN